MQRGVCGRDLAGLLAGRRPPDRHEATTRPRGHVEHVVAHPGHPGAGPAPTVDAAPDLAPGRDEELAVHVTHSGPGWLRDSPRRSEPMPRSTVRRGPGRPTGAVDPEGHVASWSRRNRSQGRMARPVDLRDPGPGPAVGRPPGDARRNPFAIPVADDDEPGRPPGHLLGRIAQGIGQPLRGPDRSVGQKRTTAPDR